jgi:hypothetical protein
LISTFRCLSLLHVPPGSWLSLQGVFDYYADEFGAILDSGTTLTRVPTPALLSVVSALDLRLNGTKVRPMDFRVRSSPPGQRAVLVYGWGGCRRC